MQEWFISIYTAHHYLVYPVIMVVGFAEGPLVSMVCGAVLALGFLNFWPVYIILMLGDLIGDTMWYFIGHRFGERFIAKFGKYLGVTSEHIDKAMGFFNKHKTSLLLVSKITNGLGLSMAVLFTAGMSRVPFGRFIATNALGQLIWSGALITVGFLFGNLYLRINSVSGKVSLVIGFIIIVVVAARLIRYWQKKFID